MGNSNVLYLLLSFIPTILYNMIRQFPWKIVRVNANIAFVHIHYDHWRNDLRAVSFVGGGGGGGGVVGGGRIVP